jgi:hypothetical protein
MDFFTSPKDLKGWVRIQESPDSAATKILEIVGKEEEQDIVDTCRQIFKEDNDNADNADNASKILFGVLAKHNLTQVKEGKNMDNKLKKQAQIMRQPGEYSMPLRVCPKLPFSVGKKLISTYNCRHYCLDSLVFDDDPGRVYCAEALWRRHVMDKFSREFKDKDGKWVGGYINSRFQVFHDDGGNQMELAHGERSRKPRPHQYSTERRLSEGRGEKTIDLTSSNNRQMVKLASVDDQKEDAVYKIFDDIVEMREAGLSDEDILYRVSEHYGRSITDVARIHKVVTKQASSHNGLIYSYDNSSKINKKAQLANGLTMIAKQNVQATNITNGQGITLKIETPVVMVSNGSNGAVFEIVDGPDAGQRVNVAKDVNLDTVFGTIEDAAGKIQEAAQETGLNDENMVNQNSQVPQVPQVPQVQPAP